MNSIDAWGFFMPNKYALVDMKIEKIRGEFFYGCGCKIWGHNLWKSVLEDRACAGRDFQFSSRAIA